MTESYKSHQIICTAFRYEDGRWKPRISIINPGSSAAIERFFVRETTFATEAEAERAGVAFAKELIDGR